MATRDQLVATALHEFATFGYFGTSLAAIAQRSGTSKSSVLYHFASKEALLEAALEPAVAHFETLLEQLANTHDARGAFGVFVDALMEHRQAAAIFLSHRGAMPDVAAFARGNALMENVAETLLAAVPTDRLGVRLAVGLAGTAEVLVMRDDERDKRHSIDDGVLRELLIDTLMALADEER